MGQPWHTPLSQLKCLVVCKPTRRVNVIIKHSHHIDKSTTETKNSLAKIC